jgi:hypothetical protein
VVSMPSSEMNASRCGATRAGGAWAAETATPTDRGEIGEVQLPHLAGSVRAAAPLPQSPTGESVIRPATPAAPRRPERACAARSRTRSYPSGEREPTHTTPRKSDRSLI